MRGRMTRRIPTWLRCSTPMRTSSPPNFACNSHTDVWAQADVWLYAANCLWDHPNPSYASAGGGGSGVDIYHPATPAVHIAGSTQAASPCP